MGGVGGCRGANHVRCFVADVAWMIYEMKMSSELHEVIKIPQQPIVSFVDKTEKTD